jgi:short-subunit dehydrogenase
MADPTPWTHALVTGASSGIGEALSRRLAREGCAVSLCARRLDLLEGLAERIRSEGGRARASALDVSRSAEIHKAVEEAEAELGPIDLVVANAGVGITAPAVKLRPEWVDQMIDVNLKGALYLMIAVLPGMIERRRGQLVGVTSLAAYRGLPGSAIYSASKSGLSTFLESIRAEVRQSGVIVTEVCPGFIRTPMTDKNRHPMPFLLEADEAARRIVLAMRAGRARYGFPWPMHALMRLIQSIPVPIYDLLARKMAASFQPRPKPHKPGGERV